MKKLLMFIVFNFYLITSSYGNQIEDFQIEGISMWDSALKHFSKAEIINNKRPYYQYIKKIKICSLHLKFQEIMKIMMFYNFRLKLMTLNLRFIT